VVKLFKLALDKKQLKQLLIEVFKEVELTAVVKEVSAILKDSTGVELSDNIKNLDTKLSDFKTALFSTILKDSTGTELSDSIKNLNVAKISGVALTARNWSDDFAKLQNFDIALSGLRDAILSKIDELGKLALLGYTTSPLSAGASWTSEVDSDAATGRIVGSVYADQAGTLYVEQSPNGTEWDVVDSFSVSADAGFGFSVEKVCQYARVRYVNGATPQTTFRLYVFKRLRVI
jgi:hypothetical protein